ATRWGFPHCREAAPRTVERAACRSTGPRPQPRRTPHCEHASLSVVATFLGWHSSSFSSVARGRPAAGAAAIRQFTRRTRFGSDARRYSWLPPVWGRPVRTLVAL